jgi:hypothetical protein
MSQLTLSQLIASTVFIFSTLFVPTSYATTITYDLHDLGLSHFRYEYTVSNDGTLPNNSAIQLFDILFDTSLYNEASLTITSTSLAFSIWSQQILGSAPNVPAAFDASANNSGIAVGAQSSGFSVEFDWLGAGLPGNQSFEIYDPISFTLLETGATQEATAPPPPTGVPLPGSLSLFLAGIIGFAALRKRAST